MKIKFLSVTDARNEILTNNYFNIIPEYEMKIRTKGYGRDYYYYSVKEFTLLEKALITSLCNIVSALFKDKARKLLPDFPICFIKMASGVDWNYPFTIGKCVVLTEVTLSNYIKKCENTLMYNQKSSDQWNLYRVQSVEMLNCATTIAHEIIHIVQRNPTDTQYKEILKIYEQWGFRKITANYLVFDHQLPYIPLTNPDGYNFNYIVEIYTEGKWYYFLPLLIFTPSGEGGDRATKEILQELTPLNNGQFLLTKKWNYTENFIIYREKFPVKQISHPNEIFATLVSEWLIKDTIYTEESMYSFYNKMDKFSD